MTLAERLAVDGYVVVDLIEPPTVRHLRAHYDRLGIAELTPFLATCNDLPRKSACDAHSAVAQHLESGLRDVLPQHEIFLAGFIMKGARSGGELEFHQDLTYTDERRHRSLLLWVPLVDVDDTTGALRVVPGSHRWTQGLRPGGLEELPTTRFQQELADRSITLNMRAGQAVIYDAALVHGSFGNTARSVRPVAAAATAPVGAELVHFHVPPTGTEPPQGHRVDVSYYLEQSLRSQPRGYEELAPWTRMVQPADIERRLGRGAGEEPVRVTPAPPPPHRRPPLLSTRRSRRLGKLSPRPALRDASLDLRLRRDGFVKIPMIDARSAAELREQYGRVHGWHGHGFEADLTNEDRLYRRRVSRLLSAALDEVVTSHFLGYVPFLRNFLCKWPDPDSALYLHRDWMYVDERTGDRSYVVWTALQDVTGPEGQLQVLRHSHRVDPMLRGTDLNGSWLQLDDEVRRRLLTVPVRAGEAVIMDNALVHCSLPNHSDEPRVVAAVGVRPASAPLVHFRRLDARLAARHEVDDDFFLTITPQGLLRDGTFLPVVERLPTGETTTPPADEFLRRLDAGVLSRLDRLRRRGRSRSGS